MSAVLADYDAFLASKRSLAPTMGKQPSAVHSSLFPFQADLTRWAIQKGRAALFADTGLGKTRMQLEWARQIGERTLILAPLAVAKQTVAEGAKLDIEVTYARAQEQASDSITIINYEMLHRFEPSSFGAVVLDESSILKATEGVYRNMLIDVFSETPYRLCCTATPAPNDIQEITNHSAFLGLMKRRDVLATFFVHDSDDARSTGWRLKGHAREAFWRWLASWGMLLKRPSDLGYADGGFALPPLTVAPVVVDAEITLSGRLFPDRIRGVTDRASVRRQTAVSRVAAAAELIENEPGQSFIAWVGLNDEGRLLSRELGERAILVEGSQTPEEKARLIERFIEEPAKVLVTKTTIAGFGMNLQHCARQVFVGINDSFEQYYQAIRRSWRFGQTQPVDVKVVISEPEQAVFENVLRKEREAEGMAQELVKHIAAYERAEIGHVAMGLDYQPKKEMALPAWL